MKDMYREKNGGEGKFSLHADKSAPANLPQGVVHHDVAGSVYEKPVELDDTIRGIDDSAHEYERKVDASMRKSMR